MFEDAEIGIPCPKCGHETKQTVGWLKANTEFTCPSCGSVIEVEAEELLTGLKKADKALADFRKTLRGFGKKR